MGLLRCATASVATASLAGSEPRQPLPQETVAVGQPLLHCERLGGTEGASLTGFVLRGISPAVLFVQPAPPGKRWGAGASSRDGVERAEWARVALLVLFRRSPHTNSLSLARASPPQVTMCDRKAVIKNADMSEEMQQDSVECATQALEKYNIEKDIAAHIKKVRIGRG